MNRWKVRKWRNYGLAAHLTVWEVLDPDGAQSATFHTWAEAMDWTSVGTRLEHWLELHLR